MSHAVIIIDKAKAVAELGDAAAQVHRRIEDGHWLNPNAAEAAMANFETAAEDITGDIKALTATLTPFLT